MSDVLGSGATDAAPEPDRGPTDGPAADAELDDAESGTSAARRRRRGTRGGRGRNRTRVNGTGPDADAGEDDDDQPELPDRPIEGKVQSPEVAERVLVRRPRIGDSRPPPPLDEPEPPIKTGKPAANGTRKRR